MNNPTHFQLTETQAGVGAQDVPSLFRVRQKFDRPSERDVAAASRALLDEVRANPRLEVLSEPVPIGYDADLNLIPPLLG